MSELIRIPPYEDVANVLFATASSTSPSEAHGILCGLICASRREDRIVTETSMIASAVDKEDTPSVNIDVLLNLYAITCKQLESMELNLELLLPDDDYDAGIRLQALCEWCHGYLIGLNLTNRDLGQRLSLGLSEEVKGAMQRISELANSEFYSNERNDSNEWDLLEVTEFVRVAVLMIYTEFNSETSVPIGETLH